jgi:hypothetical protein
MPDPNDPAAMEARKKAMIALSGGQGRASTTLTTPTIGGSYAGTKTGG